MTLLSELFGLVKSLVIFDLFLVLIVDLDSEVGEEVSINRGPSYHDKAIGEPFWVSRGNDVAVAEASHRGDNKVERLDVFVKGAHIVLVESSHCKPTFVCR